MKKAGMTFTGDTRGAIAVIFALTALILFSIVGLAIDYGRATSVRNKLQRAADAAVIADMSTLGKKDHELRGGVEARLHANLPEDLRKVPFQLVVEDDGASMTLMMKTKVKTTLMALAGFEYLPINIKANTTIAKRQGTRRASSAKAFRDALQSPRSGALGGGGAPGGGSPLGGSPLGGIDLSRLQKGDARAARELVREITRQLEAAQADGRLDGLELPRGLLGRR